MIEFKADDVKFDIGHDKSHGFDPKKTPLEFEFTGTIDIPKDSPLWKWINSGPEPKKVLKQVEEFMKKYDITPDRMVADRSTLNWLFLNNTSGLES